MKAIFNALVLLALPILAAAASPVEHIGGVTIASEIVLAEKNAVLNGAGTRRWRDRWVYVIALYLPREARTTTEAAALSGPKRMHFVFLSAISGRHLEKIFTESVGRVLSPTEVGGLIDELVAIGGAYARMGAFKGGDRVDVDWIPDSGMRVLINDTPLMLAEKNGQKLYYLDNLNLYYALMKVYMEDPSQPALQENVLGRSRSMMTLQ